MSTTPETLAARDGIEVSFTKNEERKALAWPMAEAGSFTHPSKGDMPFDSKSWVVLYHDEWYVYSGSQAEETFSGLPPLHEKAKTPKP